MKQHIILHIYFHNPFYKDFQQYVSQQNSSLKTKKGRNLNSSFNMIYLPVPVLPCNDNTNAFEGFSELRCALIDLSTKVCTSG